MHYKDSGIILGQVSYYEFPTCISHSLPMMHSKKNTSNFAMTWPSPSPLPSPCFLPSLSPLPLPCFSPSLSPLPLRYVPLFLLLSMRSNWRSLIFNSLIWTLRRCHKGRKVGTALDQGGVPFDPVDPYPSHEPLFSFGLFWVHPGTFITHARHSRFLQSKYRFCSILRYNQEYNG